MRELRCRESAGGDAPGERGRPREDRPVGRLVRWHGGTAASAGGLRPLVYTEDTGLVALFDSAGAYIHEAFPPNREDRTATEAADRKRRMVLAVAAELRALAEILGRATVTGELAAVAAETRARLGEIASELERAATWARGRSESDQRREGEE